MWNNEGFANGIGSMGDGMWHWVTGLHGILSLIFLGLIVIGIFLLIRDIRREDTNVNANKKPSAMRKEF